MPSITDILAKYSLDNGKLVDTLCVDTITDRNPEKYREEYEGERTRRNKSVGYRQNKTMNIYKEVDDKLVKTNETKTVYVAKLVFPFPEKVVRIAEYFLFGGKMNVSSDESTIAFSGFKDIWIRSLKMQTNLKRLARNCMIETKAALLFYPAPYSNEKGEKKLKLRSMLLNKDNGEFFPHFDDYGDMDAFIRRYQVTDIEGKTSKRFVIYVPNFIMHYKNDGAGWEPLSGEKNLFGKIPVVYVEQKQPEWESVGSLMDNFENRISRLADTNDYYAEPLLKIFGEVKRPPSKDEVGKMIEFPMIQDADNKITHGDAEYATWDQIPESVKLDLETTWDGIHSMTSTPDLSFNNVKGIGATSGIALKLMFMDAMIKREQKGEIFYEALQRSVAVVIAGMAGYTDIKAGVDLREDMIDISFTDQLPSDLSDAIDTIMAATGGKPVLSQESGAGLSPLSKDPEEEIKRLRSEEKSITPNEPFIL